MLDKVQQLQSLHLHATDLEVRMLNHDHRSSINVSNETLNVFDSLIHAHLQTLAKVWDCLRYWLLRNFVPDLLQHGSKFRDRS